MRRLFRWLFRIVLALAILALVASVAFILLVDTLTRELLIHRLHAQTGMEVEISAVRVGLLSSTMSIEGFKLYNTTEFGGSLCMNMPELHIEYDPAALRSRQLHLTLVRLDLEELSCILDKRGRNNFDSVKQKAGKQTRGKTWMTDMKFTGIDVLNVTLGKFRLANQASGNRQEIDFGIKNQVLRNVKTAADLAPLGLTALTTGKTSPDADLTLLLTSLLKTP